MRRLKYLAIFLTFFPVMPDLCCVPAYATETITPDNTENFLAAILFFLCVLLGNRLWDTFINSFEKGSV